MNVTDILQQVTLYQKTAQITDLIKAALTGQQFTSEQESATQDILNTEDGRRKLFEYVEDHSTYCNPRDYATETTTAQMVANCFVEALIDDKNTRGFSSYKEEQLKAFFDIFPLQAQRTARYMVEHAKPMHSEHIRALASQMTDRQMREIVPHDVSALTTVAQHLGESMGDEFYKMVQELPEKDPNRYQWGLSNGTIMEMMNALKPEHRAYALKNFTKLFKPNQVNVLLARVVLEIGGTDKQMQANAVRKLAQTANLWKVAIKDRFEIPESETGEALCRMLIYLEHLDRNDNKGKIAGLPTEEQFRQRAFEVQMSNADLYKKASEARDRLESASHDCLDAISALMNAIKEVCCANKHPEEQIIEKLDKAGASTYTKAVLSRLATLFAIYKWTDINSSVLWDEELTDKKARVLLMQMTNAGLAPTAKGEN